MSLNDPTPKELSEETTYPERPDAPIVYHQGPPVFEIYSDDPHYVAYIKWTDKLVIELQSDPFDGESTRIVSAESILQGMTLTKQSSNPLIQGTLAHSFWTWWLSVKDVPCISTLI